MIASNPILKGKEVNPANAMKRSSSSPGTRPRSANASIRTVRERIGIHEHHDMEGDNDPMEEVFHEMVARVEDLWEEIKIPQADRKFYRESLCKGPPTGVEQCQELANYIIMLKLHRKSTVGVLRAIEIREFALSKCLDLLYAINRKAQRVANHQRTTGLVVGESRETVRDLVTGKGIDSITQVLQEELVTVLRDVQLATLNVIRLIQLWRRNLWRPHPFVYQKDGKNDVNYMLKIGTDLNVLGLEVYMNTLKGVPLFEKDLLCILFTKNSHNSSSSSSSYGKRSSSLRNTPTTASNGTKRINGTGGVSFTNDDLEYSYSPSEGLSPSHEAFQPSSSGNRGDGGYDDVPEMELLEEGVEYDSPLRESFFLDRDLEELKIAANVVMEEAKLQHALHTEQRALMEKKVFIPLLRTTKAVSKKKNK